MIRHASLAVMVVACGSEVMPPKLDGTMQQQTVQAVTCPASPDATIATFDGMNSYNPMTVTIAPGQIVKFTMQSTHNAASMTPGLAVDFGQTVCLQFPATGTFSFRCTRHGFMGTVNVQ